MTDDIRAGDRILVPATVCRQTSFGGWIVAIHPEGHNQNVILPCDFLSTCTRLPPEIGVGDEVRTTFTPAIVKAIDGDIAWLRSTVGDRSYFSAGLSDLSLVKKAEKD